MSTFKNTKQHNFAKIKEELQFIFSADRLILTVLKL